MGNQHQMLHQHRAANRQNHRQQETEFNKSEKRDGDVSRREQKNSARRRERAQLPGEKRGERAEENDERQFHRQRRAPNELAGEDGVGDVPVFADEQGVALQRRRAAVGQIIALRRRADNDELAAKIVLQAVGLAVKPVKILREQIFNRRLQQMRIVRLQPPVNVEIAVTIHGNDAFGSVRAAQNDLAARQIHFGVWQIEF